MVQLATGNALMVSIATTELTSMVSTQYDATANSVPSQSRDDSRSVTCPLPVPRPKPDSPENGRRIRRLTPSEIESLRREFQASGEWMAEMLRTGKVNDL